MSNCNPNDLNVNIKDVNVPNIVPGFGLSFAPKINVKMGDLDEFGPPDLGELADLLDLITPSGSLKQPYNLKIDQSIFDAVLKYLDKAYPFLMIYKLFLPFLEIVLCIIEVLCSIPNPFKVARAIRRLFRRCIPNFLSLFPIFALPILILSLLLLLIALLAYVMQEVAKAVDLITKNILVLRNALQRNDPVVHKAALRKIAWLLCSVQNLFVVLVIFRSIFEVIKSILAQAFAIPPCDDNDIESCCTNDVCPAFFKNKDITGTGGTLQYLCEINQEVDVSSIIPNLKSNALSSKIRQSSIQFFDANLDADKAFINIVKPYDLGYDKSFFPEGKTYNKDTAPDSVPYTMNIRFLYDPSVYGRTDVLGKRYVKLNNCIITKAPSMYIDTYDNSKGTINNGVFYLAGGKAFEDNGSTPLNIDNVQASLDTLINIPAKSYSTFYLPDQNDAVIYSDVSYTLNIHHELISMTYGLITAGCMPDVSTDKAAIVATIGNIGVKQAELLDAFNDFPDIDNALSEIQSALSAFRNNVNADSAALLKESLFVTLNKLISDANNSVEKLILVTFDQYKSKISLDTNVQFTTLPIKLKLDITDPNGQPLTSGIPATAASGIANKISANATFGSLSDFKYDGSRYFYCDITSDRSGSGTVQVSFDNNVISNLNNPTDLSGSISVTPSSLEYSFVFAAPVGQSDINSDQRRDQSDIANDSQNSSDIGINNG